MSIWSTSRRYAAVLAALALVLAACGSDDSEADAGAAGAATDGDRPTVVVTTNILGDVVGQLVGDQADVVTIMPVGADPHDFQPSAQEVDRILEADVLIVNGTDFEEGLLDVIGSAMDAGVPTFEATGAVETIEFGAGGHSHDDEHSDDEDHSDDEHSDDEDHSDDEHSDEDEHGDDEDHDDHSDEDHDDHGDEDEHGDDEDHSDDEDHDDHSDDEDHSDEDEHGDEEDHDEHDHDGADPHFFTDPTRMADAVEGIGTFLRTEVDGLDAATLDAAVADYVDELDALDAEIVALVDAIPEDRRVLVTNHEVFGYFADRYGFEVVGAVIPAASTVESASAGDLAELAEIIEREGVPAIFADTSSSNALVDTLAAEVGDIDVVELFSESLGDADSEGATYLEMIRTNASRISTALA